MLISEKIIPVKIADSHRDILIMPKFQAFFAFGLKAGKLIPNPSNQANDESRNYL